MKLHTSGFSEGKTMFAGGKINLKKKHSIKANRDDVTFKNLEILIIGDYKENTPVRFICESQW